MKKNMIILLMKFKKIKIKQINNNIKLLLENYNNKK